MDWEVGLKIAALIFLAGLGAWAGSVLGTKAGIAAARKMNEREHAKKDL